MPNFSALPARIRLARANVIREVERVVEETAIVMLDYLANNTPVDTSKAISNWVANVGSNAWSDRAPHVPGRAGSTKAASVAETIRLGRAAIVGHYRLSSAIHLSNQVPYIEPLNDGTISSQPGMFVEGAILAGEIHLTTVGISI